VVLNKDLSKHFFMKINFEHVSIVDKKINLFARAVREIFNFLFGNMTFGPPCTLYTKFFVLYLQSC
jgi:hypothetical protein